MSIRIDGLGKLQAKLKQVENIDDFFDDDVFDTANETRNEMQDNTPMWTHKAGSRDSVKRSWREPKKVRDSLYTIDNDAQSRDKKHSLVNIIKYGRGEVRPKRAKKLFIPLNAKTSAKAKKRIYNNIEFGRDFVLADKVRPSKPNDFLTPVEKQQEKKLRSKMENRIRRTF